MRRGSGRATRWAAAVVVAGLGLALVGCAGWWPSDDSGRLRDGIEELASVPGPDGEVSAEVEVLGCDDRAELPMAVARFPLDGLASAGAGASNAALDDLSAWYLPRWEDLGWESDPGHGSATKSFDGRRLQAAVDAVTTEGYSIVVTRAGAALCP